MVIWATPLFEVILSPFINFLNPKVSATVDDRAGDQEDGQDEETTAEALLDLLGLDSEDSPEDDGDNKLKELAPLIVLGAGVLVLIILIIR